MNSQLCKVAQKLNQIEDRVLVIKEYDRTGQIFCDVDNDCYSFRAIASDRITVISSNVYLNFKYDEVEQFYSCSIYRHNNSSIIVNHFTSKVLFFSKNLSALF